MIKHFLYSYFLIMSSFVCTQKHLSVADLLQLNSSSQSSSVKKIKQVSVASLINNSTVQPKQKVVSVKKNVEQLLKAGSSFQDLHNQPDYKKAQAIMKNQLLFKEYSRFVQHSLQNLLMLNIPQAKKAKKVEHKAVSVDDLIAQSAAQPTTMRKPAVKKVRLSVSQLIDQQGAS